MTRIGDLSFTHDFANGYPTDATQELLFDEIDFQRACQVYLIGAYDHGMRGCKTPSINRTGG